METINSHVILLVEDDENDVLFLRMAMEKAGITSPLEVVEDGHDAINYLDGQGVYADRALHPLPALVLLDLKLPRVMGMDVLKWIRERPVFGTMVVIMLTSSRQPADIRLAYELGANAYLVKPSDPRALSEMMDAVKRFWLTFNCPTADPRGFA